MADKVDMSLDEIIKANRAAFRTGRGRDRGGFRGRARGGAKGGGRPAARKASGFNGSPRKQAFSTGAGRKFPRRAVVGAIDAGAATRVGTELEPGDVLDEGWFEGPVGKSASGDRWQHDKFQQRGGGGGGGKPVGVREQSSKLTISNLDYGVSDADIKELFTEFGPLKKAAVHYDRSGRSLGTADVIFERRTDALRAMKQYNDIPLDGRPMKIELVGEKPSLGGASGGGQVLAGRIGKKPRGGPTRPSATDGNRRGGGKPLRVGGRGGARGGRKPPAKTPTKEELDAELDAYVAKMETE